jgi:hypothetical protein
MSEKFLGIVFLLGIVLSGCGKSPEKAKADADALFNAASNGSQRRSLGVPEVMWSGKVVRCRNAEMAHVYYCAWQVRLDDGKFIGAGNLSLQNMDPGTPVDEVRLFYRNGDGDNDWAYGFFLQPTSDRGH